MRKMANCMIAMMTGAVAVSAVVATVVPASASSLYVWDGDAGDGVWQAGVSGANWLGNNYDPDPTVADEYVFVSGSWNPTSEIVLQGGSQPLVEWLAFNDNIGANPLNLVVDGAVDGTKLVLQPGNASGTGGGETLWVPGSVEAHHQISATNGGVVELRGGLVEMRVSGGAQFTIAAPIVGEGSDARMQTRGGGTLWLTGDASTFAGGVHSVSTLNFTSVGNYGEASALGTGTDGDIRIGTPTVGDARIRYVGEGHQTTNREIVLVSGRNAPVERRILSQEGTLTLTGGVREIRDEEPVSTLRLGGGGDIEIYENGISGGINLYKIGGGQVTLGTASDYTGETRLYAGTLRLEADHALPEASDLWLRGQLELAEVTQNLGQLSLGGDSVIMADLDTPFNLFFADSSSEDWDEFTLSILNWTEGSLLRFGEDATGLTQAQLNGITIDGQEALITNAGYVVPVPEPGTLLVAVAATALLTLRRTRTWAI